MDNSNKALSFEHMRRLVLLLLIGVYTTIIMQIRAQSPKVQMLEGEIRAGLTTPLGGYHTAKAQVSVILGVEGRYNFKGTPWDCGLIDVVGDKYFRVKELLCFLLLGSVLSFYIICA